METINNEIVLTQEELDKLPGGPLYKYAAQRKYTHSHREVYREISKRSYEKNREVIKAKFIIRRLKHGLNVKQSTLDKYNLKKEDYQNSENP